MINQLLSFFQSRFSQPQPAQPFAPRGGVVGEWTINVTQTADGDLLAEAHNAFTGEYDCRLCADPTELRDTLPCFDTLTEGTLPMPAPVVSAHISQIF